MIKKIKILQWGNSLAIRLSHEIKTTPNFKEGDIVDIEINNSGFKVNKRERITESYLLDNLTNFNAHTDELYSTTQQDFEY